MNFWHGAERDASFEAARERMVDHQLIPRGITHPMVLEAMRAVPREEFVPLERRERAYSDGAMPIGLGQTISQPYMVAAMTQDLFADREGRGAKRLGTVLEVGGGSGYQAAVLAQVADRVITIERVPELALRARETLARLGYDNVEVVQGDGTMGLPERAPFDAILVAAAAPAVPRALKDQLALGGRMVLPMGSRGLQELVVIHRAASGYHQHEHTRCVFVPLIGEQGWEA
jgi:protein-L-isoaspartate(D-aspartate) O-methyltransferase